MGHFHGQMAYQRASTWIARQRLCGGVKPPRAKFASGAGRQQVNIARFERLTRGVTASRFHEQVTGGDRLESGRSAGLSQQRWQRLGAAPAGFGVYTSTHGTIIDLAVFDEQLCGAG
jgi:hypothetical protein